MRALLVVTVVVILAITGMFVYQNLQPVEPSQTASGELNRQDTSSSNIFQQSGSSSSSQPDNTQAQNQTNSATTSTSVSTTTSGTVSRSEPAEVNTQSTTQPAKQIKVSEASEQQLQSSDAIVAEVIAEPVDTQIREDAKQHIENVTSAPQKPIAIAEADHFVTVEQLLELPLQQLITPASTKTVTTSSDDKAKSFAVDTGVIKAVPLKPEPQDAVPVQPEPKEPEGFTFENLKRQIVNVFSDNEETVAEQTTEHVASTAQNTTTAEVITQLDNQIKLQALLNNPDTAKDQVFFIHAVTDGDEQGLWGIIQTGVIKTFAKGIRIKDQVISANIPREADERLANRSSSFLGAILDRKVKDTYVYNYEKGILGQNPDLITPGQELIIVSFEEAELIAIYNHFVNN